MKGSKIHIFQMTILNRLSYILLSIKRKYKQKQIYHYVIQEDKIAGKFES